MRATAWIAASLLSAGSGGAQWNQFRGPGGRGLAPDEEELPVELDREKNLVWSCPVPDGHSPVLWRLVGFALIAGPLRWPR